MMAQRKTAGPRKGKRWLTETPLSQRAANDRFREMYRVPPRHRLRGPARIQRDRHRRQSGRAPLWRGGRQPDSHFVTRLVEDRKWHRCGIAGRACVEGLQPPDSGIQRPDRAPGGV